MTDFTPAAALYFLIHSPKFYLCRYLFITDKSKRHVSDLVEFLGSNFTDGDITVTASGPSQYNAAVIWKLR